MKPDESLATIRRKLETTQNIMERQKLLKTLWRLSKEEGTPTAKQKTHASAEKPTAA